MPLQNRVQPTGEIIAHPARGQFMGNRGVLHDSDQRLGKARWRHKAWVTCVLSFKNRRRALMSPRRYTELFFLDEAVAFAAGHRPCGECRRADYNRFRTAAGITTPIAAYDSMLHAQRVVPRRYEHLRYTADIAELPDGAFILSESGAAHLAWGDALLPYSPSGYGPPIRRPAQGSVTVLTPKPLVDVLHAGYALQVAQP
ncbi:hypothetical protein CEP88_05420 [Roseobacter denitrificans]|uniref:Ada DNA repair metal-binding domain-containing protein n=1 Tax=Roseobacter denitrificans (strain ATCC 33942 / OCh 114) TaxID=375451 RepID=Q164D7_ROSDO|nr:hypothetical protein [Roseobacter denitrificans]ABG32656.1 hypothetical protein RD1_3148 [Roseobacter denitrificans OCh 114]AVL52090.1 hypothetical protein CEP88_05420 [Roseobacter denitrificans]SFF93341.1 hypothetical protein SAMN05443635_10476 [Roseobacter denitrificans OCh 114]